MKKKYPVFLGLILFAFAIVFMFHVTGLVSYKKIASLYNFNLLRYSPDIPAILNTLCNTAVGGWGYATDISVCQQYVT